MSTVESIESVSEAFFRAGQWWVESLTRALADEEVPSAEGWRILGMLRNGEGLTMSEISAVMSVPPPTLTRLVDKLVDSGLVLRRVDPMDRRRVLVYLTSRGKAKVRKLAKREAVVKTHLAEQFGEDSAATLVRCLSRLHEAALD